MRLGLHIFGVEKIVKLPLVDGSKGHSLGSVQLARVQLRWLDALPLNQELLLGEVMAHQPFSLLVRHA